MWTEIVWTEILWTEIVWTAVWGGMGRNTNALSEVQTNWKPNRQYMHTFLLVTSAMQSLPCTEGRPPPPTSPSFRRPHLKQLPHTQLIIVACMASRAQLRLSLADAPLCWHMVLHWRAGIWER